MSNAQCEYCDAKATHYVADVEPAGCSGSFGYGEKVTESHLVCLACSQHHEWDYTHAIDPPAEQTITLEQLRHEAAALHEFARDLEGTVMAYGSQFSTLQNMVGRLRDASYDHKRNVAKLRNQVANMV